MVNRLANARSRLNSRSPRTTLRLPLWPGYVKSKALNAASGLLKIFGPPVGEFFVVPCANGPTCVAYPSWFQFVGQNPPLSTPTGKPEDSRQIPLNCHPPIKPSTILFVFPPNRRPRPNGSSATKNALIKC